MSSGGEDRPVRSLARLTANSSGNRGRCRCWSSWEQTDDVMKEVKLLLHDGLLLLEKVCQASLNACDRIVRIGRGRRNWPSKQSPEQRIAAGPNGFNLMHTEANTAEKVGKFNDLIEVRTLDLQLIAFGRVDGNAQVRGAGIHHIQGTPAAEPKAVGQFIDGGVIRLTVQFKICHMTTVDVLGVTTRSSRALLVLVWQKPELICCIPLSHGESARRASRPLIATVSIPGRV